MSLAPHSSLGTSKAAAGPAVLSLALMGLGLGRNAAVDLIPVQLSHYNQSLN